MTREEIWLRLMLAPKLSAERCADIASCLRTSDLHKVLLASVSTLTAQQWQAINSPDRRKIRVALAWLEHDGHHLVTYSDEDYPENLRHIYRPPVVLFVRGNRKLLTHAQVAIIGSRQASAYGRKWGAHFAAALAGRRIVITSGLAAGIDGTAHRAALSVNGLTIAVLGCGPDRCYPRQHDTLAEQIVARDGAIVSEFLPGTPPLARHFPCRNRIISGLSEAVLVVEATRKSGSLVTVRHALEQGKEVFALPGALGNEGSEGTHWLIQQGACLVTTPEEVLEQLRPGFGEAQPVCPMREPATASGCENTLSQSTLLAFITAEITPVDIIADQAGLPVEVVNNQLLELELAGLIVRVPGGYSKI